MTNTLKIIKNKKVLAVIGLVFIAAMFMGLHSAHAQAFKEIVYEGRRYLVHVNHRAIGGSASGKTLYSINSVGTAVRREAIKRGISYGFWTGCGFYFSDVGKRYVVGTIDTIPGDVCTNLDGIQTTVPADYKYVSGGVCQPIDKCINVHGVQSTIPSGFIDVGGKICQLSSDFHVFCRATANPIKPGDSVNFVAIPVNQSVGDISFRFKKTNTGEVIAERRTNDSVSVPATFATEGIHQLTINATDYSVKATTALCGVTVTNNPTALTGATGTGAGVSPGTAKLELDGSPLTNDTCQIKWEAKDVNECYLVDVVKGINNSVELTGQTGVDPGQWTLRCFDYESSATILTVESEVVTCLLNPDVRET